MIISRTPLRVSFVGGGSDLASFYSKQPGAVVSTTINKYIYITVNKSYDGRIVLRYSKEEKVQHVDELEHNLVREALKLTGITSGVDISSISDVPAEGSGLASSSAYVVGVLNALHAYKGEFVSADQLAREACQIEIEVLKKPIGKQDQYIVAYGGLEHIQFNPDESVEVSPIDCTIEAKKLLEKRLLLFYTGITRSSDTILAKQKKNMEEQTKKIQVMRQMVKLAHDMRKNLQSNDLDSFGKLLHENWLLKKKMEGSISSPQIDEWYATARKHGAIGGKILGAGGGGYLLLYAPTEAHENIIEHLPELKHEELRFDDEGSKIVHISESGKQISGRKFIRQYLDELIRCLNKLDADKMLEAIEMLLAAYRNNKKVFILGNGGSASAASHMACDLSKGTLQRIYDKREKRLKVISLTDNVALISAFANDLSYEDIFIQQLRNLVESGDVVIALSGSGNSPNVVKAVEYAKNCGAKTIGILGFKTGGKLGSMVDCAIIADSNFYGPNEDIQSVLGHIMTAWISQVKHIQDDEHMVKRTNTAVPF